MGQMRLTPAVKVLVIACVGLFLVQQIADRFLGGNLLQWLALVPNGFVFEFKFWQIFTYTFLHSDIMHLLLNMLMLVFMGAELEQLWGVKRFLLYYFVCATGGGLAYLLLQIFSYKGVSLAAPMVGASGAIYGLLTAFGILYGERVMLFMMIFPMKAKYFVWLLGAISFFSALFSTGNGIAESAHLGGMVIGFFFLWGSARLAIARRQFKERKELSDRKVRMDKGHLKLIVNNKAKGLEQEDADKTNPKTWH